jgi:hypothetical protein
MERPSKQVAWGDVKLAMTHGMPKYIVMDRDPTFTSNLWKEFFKHQGAQLHIIISYHPQTNGQTNVVNKCMEAYFKCLTLKK